MLERVICTAVLAILSTTPLAAAGAPPHDFTLHQVLSAPFPTDLVAAPEGGRLAWVFNDEGARNVWVAEPQADGSFRSRALTGYKGDGGVDVGDLSWSASGRQIYYTRGGSLEGGPPVNPQSTPSGPEAQAVWKDDLDRGAPHEIGPGHSPAPSPHGDGVAFLSGGQIWIAQRTDSAPTQLVHDRGDDVSLKWSPDGSRLAFVSNRSGRTSVGVLDVAARRIVWMSPSVDSDMAPEFSPDGQRIAFVRIPAGSAEVDFTPHRNGPPWSIWVCDVTTGTGRVVWTAAGGRGSVFHPTITDRVLMWASGDKIVFPWERTGWLHLYTVPVSGGEAAELTSGGSFEVFNTALSPDRNHVIYSSNRGDTERWHLWRVAASGGGPEQITGGSGIEDYPNMASDGRVVGVRSDAHTPMRPFVVAGDRSMQDLAPGSIPRDFPSSSLVDPQTVVFSAADGLDVHGQMFLPPPGRAKSAPAVLFFHGGPYRQMFPAWHPMDAYSFMYGFNQYLANEGYVVLSVNYRGGIGYGLDFREADRFGAAGASELNDILGAARFLRSRQDVDPKRVGIWGGSYGGLMTALGLARAPDLLAAGVDYAGVHDWRTMQPQMSGAAAQLAYDSSAIASVGQWRAPVLIAHSDDDRQVPFAQSVELIEALRQRNIPLEQLILPDEVHALLRHQSWERFFEAAGAFLNRHLQPAPVP